MKIKKYKNIKWRNYNKVCLYFYHLELEYEENMAINMRDSDLRNEI